MDVDDGDESDEEVGPVPPSATGKRKATEEEDEEDEFGFESDDEQESDPLPVSHEIVLKDHNKVRVFPARHTLDERNLPN